jgi:hypothetical protein
MTEAVLITPSADVLSGVTRDIPLFDGFAARLPSRWPTSILLAVPALVLWPPGL